MVKSSRGVVDPVDAAVGTRLRERRTVLGFSQITLAEAVGLTFQQVQKYERGANRISASRLYQFACILGVSVDYFFETLDVNKSSLQEIPVAIDDPARLKEVLTLIRAFNGIENSNVRQGIYDLTKSLAEE
jgi:transcriptional regulator with XRE-family HTH domain